MKRFPRLFLIGLLPLAGGCSSVLTRGTLIAEHTHGNAEDPKRAPADGDYSLYNKFGDTQPLHSVPVQAGDPIGFRTGRTGQIDAIAGDDEWTLSDGDYIWKRDDPEN